MSVCPRVRRYGWESSSTDTPTGVETWDGAGTPELGLRNSMNSKFPPLVNLVPPSANTHRATPIANTKPRVPEPAPDQAQRTGKTRLIIPTPTPRKTNLPGHSPENEPSAVHRAGPPEAGPCPNLPAGPLGRTRRLTGLGQTPRIQKQHSISAEAKRTKNGRKFFRVGKGGKGPGPRVGGVCGAARPF